MSTHNIIVVNLTGAPLFVTGHYGSDLSGMTEGQQIANGTSATVAQWNAGSSVQDNWDFIYFGRHGGELEYQIYMEKTAVSQNKYQFMGFYAPNPNNQNSNPKPFNNKSCSVTGRTPGDDWVYVFLTSPS
jgi:hypothetical protein